MVMDTVVLVLKTVCLTLMTIELRFSLFHTTPFPFYISEQRRGVTKLNTVITLIESSISENRSLAERARRELSEYAYTRKRKE